jgi:pyrroline-5-carboxylate reductase
MYWQTAVGIGLSSFIAPAISTFLTAPMRRLVKRHMKDGKLKRAFLTPLGYTAEAKQEAALNAAAEDARLLLLVKQKV